MMRLWLEELMRASEMLTRFERVNRTAIRAFGAACAADIQENLGVVVPNGHARLRARAEHAALVVQIGR